MISPIEAALSNPVLTMLQLVITLAHGNLSIMAMAYTNGLDDYRSFFPRTQRNVRKIFKIAS